ncbi:MAG: hypothetical protein WD069_18805 [Planctomycetales bacterium]
MVGVLDAAGILYVVTGSYASSLPGEPRATHYIDLPVSRIDALWAVGNAATSLIR